MKSEDKKKAICRTCLKYDVENNGGISRYEKYNDVYVYEKINYIARIEISTGDNLPNRICTSCFHALDVSYNFKQLCERSHTFLQSESLNASQTETNIKNEISDTDEVEVDFDRKSPSVIQELAIEDVLSTDEKTQPNSNETEELKLKCDDCGNIFKSKCKLRVHWRKEHLLDHLTCPHCKLQFKSYRAFNNHLKKRGKACIEATKVRIEGYGQNRIFYCKDCNVSSKRIQTLSAHILIHSGEKPFKCNMCDKSYSQLSSLQSHKEYAHKQYIKEVTCDQCGKHFKGRYSWTRHLQTHRTEKLQCSVCNKLYSSKCVLKAHMKRHSSVKSYTCEFCAKAFYLASDLCNHKVRAHLKNKIYSCDICEYKAPNHTLLSKHRIKHTSSNLACQVCGMFMQNKEQLTLHQKRHFDKKFKCTYCDKLFFTKRALSRHVKGKHNVHPVKNEVLVGT